MVYNLGPDFGIAKRLDPDRLDPSRVDLIDCKQSSGSSRCHLIKYFFPGVVPKVYPCSHGSSGHE